MGQGGAQPGGGRIPKISDAVPLLFVTLWPFVSVAAHNRGEFIDLDRVALVAGTVVACACGLAFSLRLAARQWPLWSLADLAGLLTCLFFSFPLAERLAGAFFPSRARYTVGAWVALLLVVLLVHRFLGRNRALHGFLSAAGLALVFLPAAQFGLSLLQQRPATPPRDAVAPVSSEQLMERRSTYFIILDGYARMDQLQRVLEYDNSDFIAALRERGFQVLDRAVANYGLSRLSIAATLNAEFMLDESRDLGIDHAVDVMRGNNAFVRFFTQRGYRYVHAPPGVWGLSACGEPADRCPGGRRYGKPCGVAPHRCLRGDASVSGLTETDILLLRLTPIPILVGFLPIPAGTKDAIRKSVLSSFTSLDDVRQQLTTLPSDEPVFAFIHIMQPHPPNLFEADCTPKEKVDLNLQAWSNTQDAYLDNLRCANRQTLELLDAILEKEPSALVIIQSDHGSAFTLDLDAPLAAWDQGKLLERFAVLNAMRLPAHCAHLLYPEISLINTFPVISACLEQRKASYLPDTSFLTPNRSSHPEFGRVSRINVNEEEPETMEGRAEIPSAYRRSQR